MKHVGLHISAKDLVAYNNILKQYFNVIQIFAGQTQSFKINPEVKKFIKRFSGDYKIIIHSPFIVNLTNVSHRMYEKTLVYMKEIAELGEFGLYGYVTHLGLPYTKAEMEEGNTKSKIFTDKSLTSAIERLLPYFERNKVLLMLENTPGNNHGSDIANTGYLLQKARQFNSPWFKMCWDTEHSYANGCADISNIASMTNLKNMIGLIHFNAIEEGVEKGNHKDRHSKTTFETCTKFDKQAYINFYKAFSSIPMVFERGSSLELSIADAKFLKENDTE